jgi:transaldolase
MGEVVVNYVAVEDVMRRAAALAESGRRVLVGITGPPGAGKTALAKAIVNQVGHTARFVGLGGFHVSQSPLLATGKSQRIGSPDIFDGPGVVALVKKLREQPNMTIYAPEYRRDPEEVISASVSIEPYVRLVVVEGNYLLVPSDLWGELRSLLDEVWYVDVEDDVRLGSSTSRHQFFAKSVEASRECALVSQLQNAELAIATRESADLVVSVRHGDVAYSHLEPVADAAPSIHRPSNAILEKYEKFERITLKTALQRMTELGQSPWIDFITRDFTRDGELARMIDYGISGLTSNPSIFQEAIAKGTSYDDQLRELMKRLVDPRELFVELAREDVRTACDLLRPLFDRGAPIRNGWVSLEVDPNLANDAIATTAEAIRLYELVQRPNLFVKIPGTKAGLQAIENTIALGIPINVTLLFSLERHREAAEAYIRGLRRFRDSGGDLAKVASVASFFLSRVDIEADRRLEIIGGHDDLKGTLAIANAKLAYQTFKEVFAGPDWAELEQLGASPQRCLWASTSIKNPGQRDVLYIEELIGPDTVTTIPPATLNAFIDHGRVENTLDRDVDGAKRTFEAFGRAGIDYLDVVETLEREGIEKFTKSFHELINGVAAKRTALGLQ